LVDTLDGFDHATLDTAKNYLAHFWLPLLKQVEAVAAQSGVKMWVVGGVVRDLLFLEQAQSLNSEHLGAGTQVINFSDVDCCIEGDISAFVLALTSKFPNAKIVESRFLTVRVSFESAVPLANKSLDFAHFRTETYTSAGALPLVSPSRLHHDVYRRDFSVNALYIPFSDFLAWIAYPKTQQLKPLIIDHVAGSSDLAERRIEVLHALSCLDDPTRVFRAARYCALIKGSFGSIFHQSTKKSFETGAFEAVSHFRKWNELKKCCECLDSTLSIKNLFELGIFKRWPPLPPEANVLFLADVQEALKRHENHMINYNLLVALWYVRGHHFSGKKEHNPEFQKAIQCLQWKKKDRKMFDEFVSTIKEHTSTFADIVTLAKNFAATL
jgi:tRNA nucleotidyltransferase (CCA-adding enzyme)